MDVEYIEEMILNCKIVCKNEHLQNITSVCENKRGIILSTDYMANENVAVTYKIPLSEAIENFFDELKGCSQGMASLDSKVSGYVLSEVKIITILINQKEIESLSF